VKKVWVIAGGSGGLGRETARCAYSAGYPVAVIGRDGGALQSLKVELEALGRSKVTTHVADLSDRDATQRALDHISTEHGTVGTLVNCAGTWIPRVEAKQLSAALITESLNLNFFTAFNPTQAVLSARTSGEPLSLIFVGATASARGGARTGPFCLAKAAVRSLAQSLARELGPQGVHVAHLIIDGVIDNERTRKLNPELPVEHFINPVSIARSIMQVVEQEPSCWTLEWDVRPFIEKY
jgi:NAD(P)-dependent dehydrogenase (short-subunit alcohol dehydrogenase family)